MIHNLSDFEEELVFVTADDSTLTKATTEYFKPDLTREYFVVDSKNKHFTVGGKYTHPSADDVLIVGDSSYALKRILESKRQGSSWDFKLLLMKLIKEKFSEPKKFAATHKSL